MAAGDSGELAGRIAIVTGGATGIGRAITELFSEQGARVVIADIDGEHGEALAAELGERVCYRPTDVGDRADLDALFAFVDSQFGAVDVLVNNAAITGAFSARFLDDDMADFERVMQVNLAGLMYASQQAARRMRDRGGGSIVNLASIAALNPGYAIASYRAAKAGVINFTRSLAIDLGEYGIRVNAIAPGSIPTSMGRVSTEGLNEDQAAAMQAELDEAWLISQPIKRRGTPRDVAQAALFFAGERSAYVTGQVLAVDGGGSAGEAINRTALLARVRAKYFPGEGEEGA
ncbi:SDR family NAD(P)-dependent oxidoreductase [Haliea sp. E17]|uniref:SDR family NAD(P)-dependent oxidoreductase n=1 Tax=Haliea sp. E17 TaxID=3401576 RepID=UPI003AAC10CC